MPLILEAQVLQAARGTAGEIVTLGRIHDGDTPQEPGKVSIRMLGIDAPELGQKPWGAKSRDFLIGLIGGPGTEISLVKDSRAPDRDRYGRLLRWIYVGDNQLVNLDMVRQGWALCYNPGRTKLDHWVVLLEAEQEARSSLVGIWSATPAVVPPWLWRRGVRTT
jgi:micrococcal nuclease